MSETFLECKTALRGMAASGQHRDLRLPRSTMNKAESILERRQPKRFHDIRRNPVTHRSRIQVLKRLADESPQAALPENTGARIDGCQRFLEGRRLLGHPTILGMDDLQPKGSAAHTTETTEPRAARHA